MTLSSAPFQTSKVSNSLQVRGVEISAADAEEIASRHYGLKCKAKLLSGEKDANFHLQTIDNDEFLLKVVNPGEAAGVTSLHTQALLHVEKVDPGLPVQRIMYTAKGEPDLRIEFAGEGPRAVRVVTFQKGLLQRNVAPTAPLLRNIGAMLARLQLALKDFVHSSAVHESTWDLLQASTLRSLFPAVSDPAKRTHLETQLNHFEAALLPQLLQMRSQVAHNDLSSDNIVVDPGNTEKVSGIIDFGDMVHTAVAADIAVGAAYQLSDSDYPLDTALEFISGFSGVRPLEFDEIEILYDLIMTRMVTRLAITEWRASQFPENKTYILRNTPKSWAQFERLRSISRKQATDDIRRACNTRSI